MTQVPLSTPTALVIPPSVTSWKDLDPEQKSFTLANGPPPGDQGAVNGFTSLFVERYEVVVSPQSMRDILAKADRKKRRSQKGSNGTKKEKFVRRLTRRFVA